ncbi:MAG: PPC domain-containing DNA-binding protein [Candidatus Micrarchaeota archaeon]
MRALESAIKRALVLRLEKGEEVVNSIERACIEHGINAGLVFGIGALSECTLYASASANHLEPNALELKEPLEIASASGNITLKEGKPYLHLHATLGRADHLALAGHLKRGVISLTGEFFILESAGPLLRKRDESLKMDLIDLNLQNTKV